MTTASGVSGGIGWKRETTHGTFTAPTEHHELVSESLAPVRNRVMSKGLRNGRLTHHRFYTNQSSVSGDIVVELFPSATGTLLRNALGAPVSAAKTGVQGVFEHTFTPKTLAGESMSVLVARPDVAGTIHAYSVAGAQCTSWSLEVAAAQDGFCTWTSSLYGSTWATASAPSSYSYTNEAPFSYEQGELSIGGTTLPVESFTLSGENMLQTDRFRVGNGNTPLNSIDNGRRTYKCSVSLGDYQNPMFANFLADSAVTMQATLAFGANERIVLDLAGYVSSVSGPNISGEEALTLGFEMDSLHGTSDSSAWTVTLTNGEATIT